MQQNHNLVISNICYKNSFEKYVLHEEKEGRVIDKNFFTDNKIIFQNTFDYFNLKHLVIDKPSEDFKMEEMELKLCGQVIYKISFDLYRNIQEDFEQVINDKIIYNLPWDIKDVITYPLNKDTKDLMTMEIKYQGKYDSAVLYNETVLKNENSRKDIFTKQINIRFTQEYSFSITNYKTDIALSGYHSGLFITGCNLDNLEYFKLVMAGYVYFEYDKLEVKLFFKKFNDNCFYVPFNTDKNSYEVTKSGINFFNANYNTFIDIIGPEFKGMCYALTNNAMMYNNGEFKGVAYSF